MSVLPLPKFAHPDFANLRKRPIGPVVADLDNPIARLASTIVLPDKAVDLIAERKLAIVDTGTDDIRVKADYLDAGLQAFREFTDLGNFYTTAGYTWFAVFRVTEDSGTSWEEFFGLTGPTALSNCQMTIGQGHTTDNIAYYHNSLSNATFTTLGVSDLEGPNFHRVACTWDGSNVKLWIDEPNNNETQAFSVAMWDGVADFLVGSGLDRTAAGGGFYGECDINLFAFCNDVVLPDTLIHSWLSAPYQVLKPAEPLHLFVPVDSGASVVLTGISEVETLTNVGIDIDVAITSISENETLADVGTQVDVSPTIIQESEVLIDVGIDVNVVPTILQESETLADVGSQVDVAPTIIQENEMLNAVGAQVDVVITGISENETLNGVSTQVDVAITIITENEALFDYFALSRTTN